jgi:hypothetical protein
VTAAAGGRAIVAEGGVGARGVVEGVVVEGEVAGFGVGAAFGCGLGRGFGASLV